MRAAKQNKLEEHLHDSPFVPIIVHEMKKLIVKCKNITEPELLKQHEEMWCLIPFLDICSFNKVCLVSFDNVNAVSYLVKYMQINKLVLGPRSPKNKQFKEGLEIEIWKIIGIALRHTILAQNFYVLENNSFIPILNTFKDQYLSDLRDDDLLKGSSFVLTTDPAKIILNFKCLQGYLKAVRMLLISSVDEIEEQCPEFETNIDKLLVQFTEKARTEN